MNFTFTFTRIHGVRFQNTLSFTVTAEHLIIIVYLMDDIDISVHLSALRLLFACWYSSSNMHYSPLLCLRLPTEVRRLVLGFPERYEFRNRILICLFEACDVRATCIATAELLSTPCFKRAFYIPNSHTIPPCSTRLYTANINKVYTSFQSNTNFIIRKI